MIPKNGRFPAKTGGLESLNTFKVNMTKDNLNCELVAITKLS